MITLISSTNRPNSVSLMVTQQYAHMLEQRGESTQIISLESMPDDFLGTALYHNSGKNEHFNILRSQVEEAQKFAFIIPEYNGSFPGVLKLFIDGLKFPGTLRNKKAGLIGVSSGIQGGALALSHINDVFNYLGMHVMANRVKLYKIEDKLQAGKVADPQFVQLLERHADQLIQF
jgi:chromate reductase